MYKVGIMPEVGIAELRRELKAWLDRVRSGDEVIVTDRGRPVARFSPIDVPSRFDTLISRGVVSPPTRPRTAATSRPRISTPEPVSDLVIEERERRRA